MVRYITPDGWDEPSGSSASIADPADRRDPIKHPFGRTPRRRVQYFRTDGLSGRYFYRPSGAPAVLKSLRASGVQRTDDTVGNWKTTARSNYDAGGHFDSSTLEVRGLSHTSSNLDFGFDPKKPIETYSGVVFPGDEIRQLLAHIDDPAKGPKIPPRFELDLGVTRSFLMERGATAIARTLPTAPSVSLAQSLGELREGLPNLIGSSARRGNLSGEFLNVQFSVLPTVSDIKQFRTANQRSIDTIAQWHRDSGRRVRRRYTFTDEQPETELSTYTGKAYVPTGGLAWCSSNGSLSVRQKTTRKVWFSGAYRYFIPEGISDLERELRELNRLIGFVPTPETVWNLTPFSWLADWTGNYGDVIRNTSLLGTDGLVLTYGYIMCHTVSTWEYVWRGNLYRGSAPIPSVVTATVVKDRKQRLGASPYGAGWTGISLSEKQLAILAALGFSKDRR